MVMIKVWSDVIAAVELSTQEYLVTTNNKDFDKKKTVKSMKMFICTFPLSILYHMPFSHFHRVISDWGDFCKKEYFLSVKNGLRGICLFREFLHCNVEYS